MKHSIHPFPILGGICLQCVCGASKEVAGRDESARLAMRAWAKSHLEEAP